jgi:hypothetical protein
VMLKVDKGKQAGIILPDRLTVSCALALPLLVPCYLMLVYTISVHLECFCVSHHCLSSHWLCAYECLCAAHEMGEQYPFMD